MKYRLVDACLLHADTKFRKHTRFPYTYLQENIDN